MAGPEPVEYFVFKLPPEHEIFSTLRTLLKEIAAKFERLDLVMFGYSKTHPFSGEIQRLKNARAAATTGVQAVASLMFILTEVAEQYLKLPNELSPVPRPAVPLNFFMLLDKVRDVAGLSQKGYQAMTQLIQDATDVVEKIRSCVESGNSDNLILTQENAEVVDELILAAKTSASKLQDSEKNLRELEQHLYEVSAKAETSPPPIKEADVVHLHEEWTDLWKVLNTVMFGVAVAQHSLEDVPRMYTEEAVPQGVPADVIRATSASASVGPKPQRKSTPVRRL